MCSICPAESCTAQGGSTLVVRRMRISLWKHAIPGRRLVVLRFGTCRSLRGAAASSASLDCSLESDEKFAKSIFWSGATGQDFTRSKMLQAMKSLPQVFFAPGLRGKFFRGAKFCKR